MKKIVITGALGYIGTELCKLYSGESWFHNIIAIDNRFVSKRVNQLSDEQILQIREYIDNFIHLVVLLILWSYIANYHKSYFCLHKNGNHHEKCIFH